MYHEEYDTDNKPNLVKRALDRAVNNGHIVRVRRDFNDNWCSQFIFQSIDFIYFFCSWIHMFSWPGRDSVAPSASTGLSFQAQSKCAFGVCELQWVCVLLWVCMWCVVPGYVCWLIICNLIFWLAITITWRTAKRLFSSRQLKCYYPVDSLIAIIKPLKCYNTL